MHNFNPGDCGINSLNEEEYEINNDESLYQDCCHIHFWIFWITYQLQVFPIINSITSMEFSHPILSCTLRTKTNVFVTLSLLAM